MILYTIGFQGSSLADFLKTLDRHKIDLLIDIRENAISRKPGFSKNALKAALQEVGIDYIHYRALGPSRDVRKTYAANQNHNWLKQQYLEAINAQPDLIRELMELIYQHTCCLMCLEADPAICHRTILANYLHNQLDPEIEIQNLFVD